MRLPTHQIMPQQKQSATAKILLLVVVVVVMMLAPTCTLAFHNSPRIILHPKFSTIKRTQELAVVLDPTTTIDLVSQSVQSSVDHSNSIPALVSTMLTGTIAHGHSNPLFGPPDPILQAGKSIAPSAKALLDMGLGPSSSTTVGELATAAASSDTTTTAAAATTAVTNTADFQASIQAVMKKGWKILDSQNLINGGQMTHFPGFQETRGILPEHNPNLPAETPATFAAQVEWSAKFLTVVDKLPTVAFWYAMLEFFILRPGIDLYKEDIENDGAGVVAESVVVAGVRLAALSVLGIVTVGIFG